jgi:hypothetical protein
MELDVNGTIVAKPAADDIVRALDAGSFPQDWYIALDDGAGGTLDAQAQPDGTFTLSYGNDKRRPPETVDAAAVKAAYLTFLAGAPSRPDDRRSGKPSMKFVPDTRPLKGKSGDQPPLPAMIVMIGVIVLVGAIFAIEDWSPGTVRKHVPYGNSDVFWVGLIFFPMIALVVVAAVTKLVEFRAAKGWVRTTGRILSSGIEVRHHQFAGEPETVKNVPAIRYEFHAGTRKVIGSRIGIGDDSLATPEATLARYPVGANVTVYYDADDPMQCVLDRGGPDVNKPELLRGCAGGIAILAAFGGAIYWMFTYGPDIIDKHFPHHKADPRFSIFAICFGLAALLFFFAARRTSKHASNWPSVRGTIVKSEVEQFEERDSDGRYRKSYRPAIEYTYAVHGRELHGNQIKLMMQVSGSEGMAARTVAKYPKDSAVAVHYDPANPTTAALENPTGATWIIAIIALAMFALAAWSLGVFG